MKEKYIALMLIIPLLLVPLFSTGAGENTSDVPKDNRETRGAGVTFTNVSEEVGLSGMSGNYFSWGDFDNDGHQDLLVNGRKLFRNTGPPDYHFEDATEHAGIDRPVRSGVWGDFDNDGWLDIFCGGGSPTSDHPHFPDILWHNQKDGTFEDATVDAGGISDTFPTVAGAWADYDRDGHIDLYMVNYENGSLQGYPDHFWKNNGDMTFTNMTEASGMSEYDHPYQGRGASWADFDNDGFQDLYVSNYRIMRNYLYRNTGEGAMEESAEVLGVEGHGNNHPVTQDGPYYGHSLGSSWGDLDNDGDLDLWVTNLAHKDVYRGPICDDSYLFENMGEESGWSFRDRREGSGIPIKPIPGGLTEGDELMVSSAMADYDNDGDLDLFIPQIYNDLDYSYSYLYSNQGNFTFEDVSEETGIRVWHTYGSAWCDYNEDGWIDLVTGGGVWNGEAGETQGYMIHLYRNNGASEAPGNKWLEVALEGRGSNSAAIGARVVVNVDRDGDGSYDSWMTREVQGGTGAQGQQDSMVLHFGLGEPVEELKVYVIWPMGRVVALDDPELNTVHRVFEPTDPVSLEMSAHNFKGTDDGVVFTLDVENPSPYGLDHLEIEPEVTIRDDTRILPLLEIGSLESDERISREILIEGAEISSVIELSAEVCRCYPPVSDGSTFSFVFDPSDNSAPQPVIDGPSQAEAGELLLFSGADSFDTDGEVVMYRFDMGDGTVTEWASDPVQEHSYSAPGQYTVRLSVQDDLGAVSTTEAVLELTVTDRQVQGPKAEIISIEPVVSIEGDRVYFEGRADPGEQSVVTDIYWTSSLDGGLSEELRFSTERLSVGVHEITLEIRDSSGQWSLPDTAEITVEAREDDELWVSVYPIGGEVPCDGRLEVNGTAGPMFIVEYVEVRVDSGPWKKATGSSEWSYVVDCSLLDEGPHVIYARSVSMGYYSDPESVSFELERGNEEDDAATSDVGSGEGNALLSEPVLLMGGALVVVAVLLVMVWFLVRGPGKRRLE